MADPENVNLNVGGANMPTTVYHGKKDHLRGGVILIHGGYGLEPGVLRMAKRLSLVKYTVVAPDMYHRQGDGGDVMARIANLSWEEAQADIGAARAYLMDECGLPADKIAIVGFCMGGALAWMSAAALDVGAAVVYYPHEVFQPFGKGGPTPIDMSGDIKVPVLGHFGVEDTNPSPEDMGKMDAALNDAGVPHQFCEYKKPVTALSAPRPITTARPHRPHPSTGQSAGWISTSSRASRKQAALWMAGRFGH